MSTAAQPIKRPVWALKPGPAVIILAVLVIFAALAGAAVDRQVTARPQSIEEPKLEPRFFAGYVVKIKDGDTVNVRYGVLVEEIRISGVDCPEIAHNSKETDQPWGIEARDFVARELAPYGPPKMGEKGRTVTVKFTKREGFGRLLGDIEYGVPPKSLRAELVKAGLAWHFVKYDRDPVLQMLEHDAKAAGAGLWCDEGATPPWEWRAEHKK